MLRPAEQSSRHDTPVKRLISGLLLSLILGIAPALAQEHSYNFNIEEAGSEALLDLSTVEGLPCAGYTIRTAVHWEEDTAVVVLLGLIVPTPCVHGFDVATAQVLLKRGGKAKFTLRIREGDYTDIWKVLMTIKGISATPVHAGFTSYAP